MIRDASLTMQRTDLPVPRLDPARLTARLFYRLQLERNGVRERLSALDEQQWWSADRVREESWRRVQSLVMFAASRVPYYRNLFRAIGADPRDIRSADDFARLPILSKAIIQAHASEMIAEGVDRSTARINHTGGSTGRMLTFLQDSGYHRANEADKLWAFSLCGYRPGDRWAFLWGNDHDVAKGPRTTLKQRLLYNRRWINAFDLDRGQLPAIAAALARFKPRVIAGYVSSLTMLAEHLERSDASPIAVAVQATAETLSLAQRRLIERAFGCPVFNRYGCREVGLIAHECDAHEGLHLLAPTNYVEFTAEPAADPADGLHRIVVTNLENHIFPLIRYDTEDLARPGPDRACACGRGLPKVDAVVGRVADVIVSPDGRLLHGEFFTHLFYGVRGVLQFQLVQVSESSLVLRIVRSADFEAASIDRLRDLIARHGSPHFDLRFEFPAAIPSTPSGKFRFTASLISENRGGDQAVPGLERV